MGGRSTHYACCLAVVGKYFELKTTYSWFDAGTSKLSFSNSHNFCLEASLLLAEKKNYNGCMTKLIHTLNQEKVTFKRPCGYKFKHLLYRFFKGCIFGLEVNLLCISSHSSHQTPSQEPKWLIYSSRCKR